jgi:glycosyltransferase involved in cell wall biosynthesis
MTRVCHLSTAHNGLDVRIFHKECVSLASAGFNTHLVICASDADVQMAALKGVNLHQLKVPSGRFTRMLFQSFNCYKLGRRVNADIYHCHDPELLPFAMLLALFGKKVIYDAHEDLPKDILSKEWIKTWLRIPISKSAAALEWIGARFFLSVVTATPFIAKRFKEINKETLDINNFPLLGRLDEQVPWADKAAEVCYVGGIGRDRGIAEVVQAMGQVQSGVRLNLCGRFTEPAVEQACKAMPGWQAVNEHGFVDRAGVRQVLGRSMAGLVTLRPIINYLDALPVKMFEYMAAGIPVIASDFPLWREIVLGNQCGLCVDPMDPTAISKAIDYLVQHPDEARLMGENGRRAVLARYNWSVEEAKLLAFYKQILQH